MATRSIQPIRYPAQVRIPSTARPVDPLTSPGKFSHISDSWLDHIKMPFHGRLSSRTGFSLIRLRNLAPALDGICARAIITCGELLGCVGRMTAGLFRKPAAVANLLTLFERSPGFQHTSFRSFVRLIYLARILQYFAHLWLYTLPYI
jgi:hypothetical protein